MSKPIVFVTSNEKKLEEFQRILGEDFPRKIIHQKIDLREYQDEFDKICEDKCRTAAKIIKGPVIIEDTSLCFEAWSGLPGPYIKWFLEKLGSEGLYKMISPWGNTNANAICIFAYCENEDDSTTVHLFKGEAPGTIVKPRGPENFGWDSCFQPLNYNYTYAELSKEVKNKISHRALALAKLKEFFLKQQS